MPDQVKALINGRAADQVSIRDRGLLYGQTVFETIAVSEQQPLLLESHLRRLDAGCERLGIESQTDTLKAEITDFCSAQASGNWVLRVTLSMGSGGRGYQNPEQPEPLRILSFHPYPDHPREHWQQGIHLGLSEVRLAQQPLLAGIKHGNRLEQILARSQWQPEWQEALLLDYAGNVVEATQSNVFIRTGNQLATPDLSDCGVAGIMREQVLEIADNVGASTRIVSLSNADIVAADEVFLSNSVIGIWPVKRYGEQHYDDFTISHKLLKTLQENGSVPLI